MHDTSQCEGVISSQLVKQIKHPILDSRKCGSLAEHMSSEKDRDIQVKEEIFVAALLITWSKEKIGHTKIRSLIDWTMTRMDITLTLEFVWSTRAMKQMGTIHVRQYALGSVSE